MSVFFGRDVVNGYVVVGMFVVVGIVDICAIVRSSVEGGESLDGRVVFCTFVVDIVVVSEFRVSSVVVGKSNVNILLIVNSLFVCGRSVVVIKVGTSVAA